VTEEGEAVKKKKITEAKNTNNKQWRALCTKSKSEKKVSERLLRAGFDVFLPLKMEMRQWSDRKKKVQVPLIPSHVFIHATDRELNTILATPGVVTVLKYLGRPALIRSYEIENLKIISALETEISVHRNRNLKKGSPVRVVKGPFQGVTAIVVMEKGKHRVLVELTALNQACELTIPIGHLEVLKTAGIEAS
jgi:transcriptional antiterminator RfaH